MCFPDFLWWRREMCELCSHCKLDSGLAKGRTTEGSVNKSSPKVGFYLPDRVLLMQPPFILGPRMMKREDHLEVELNWSATTYNSPWARSFQVETSQRTTQVLFEHTLRPGGRNDQQLRPGRRTKSRRQYHRIKATPIPSWGGPKYNLTSGTLAEPGMIVSLPYIWTKRMARPMTMVVYFGGARTQSSWHCPGWLPCNDPWWGFSTLCFSCFAQ
jgi:hypothetical protein